MYHICLIKNEVKITKPVAKALFKAQICEAELWYELGDVVADSRLRFYSDHYEHMDWLRDREHLVEILLKYKVKGDICFGSLDGDNKDKFWGYRFDGYGGMCFLRGDIKWLPC